MSDNLSVNRRRFLKTTATGAVAATLGANIVIPGRANAARKKLRILQWVHFVPAYDEWFNKQYTKEWGDKNDTEVTVDNIGIAGIAARASAEISAQKGHDLFLFNWPPPTVEEQTVDMKDVYQELERKLGKAIDLGVKSTYNPKTRKYYAFSPSFTPDPVNYRQDLFGQVGLPNGPQTWDEVRTAGARIKKQFGNPVGIGLANEIDTGMAMRTIMYAFGAGTHADSAVGVVAQSYHLGMAGLWYQWMQIFNTPFYWLLVSVFRRARCLTTGDTAPRRCGAVWFSRCTVCRSCCPYTR